MGIRDKRFYRAVNRIIQEELQKGNLPSSKEFAWRLSSYLQENNLSRPEFTFRPAREGATASSFEYNHSMKSVYGDLDTLYESTIDLHNMLAKNFSKFEVDKSKLEYEINVLENQLKEDIHLYAKNGFLSSVYDVFDDAGKVDATKSTAYVDIKNHEVSIPEVKNTSYKIYPKASASFNLLPEIIQDVQMMPVSGNPIDALNDSMNSTWQLLLLANKKQNVGGYYTISFEEKQRINRVTISLHSIKPTLVRFEFTPDNLNWFTLPYYEDGKTIANQYNFDFPSIEVKQLRAFLSKNEPDEQVLNDTYTQQVSPGGYKYLMGIKHIGMYHMDYPSEATLISSPLKVSVPTGQNFSINEVSLSVEEDIPGATDIKYYIALPEANKEPEWKPISPVDRESPQHDQIIDFRNITRAPAAQFMINPYISIGEYELESLYTNGIQFYMIGEVENAKIVQSSERLFVGKDSWGVKRFEYQHLDHVTHVPSINDWATQQHYEYDFIKIEDGKPGLLQNKTTNSKAYNYMFTAGILSEKYQEVESAIPASTEPIAIYVNGEEVFKGMPDASSKVVYKFNYGWNEVVVLMYVRNTEAKTTLDLNLDIRKYGANIYSQARPLEKIAIHDLRYNTKSNDRTKYAIYEVNEKAYIVLNHAVPGLEYDFFYNYVDGDTKDTILFKAEFKKNETASNVSPKLKSYRLRFS